MIKIRISLALKCQIMFGAAVLLILAAALSVPWFRMKKQTEASQRETARQLADAWLDDAIQLSGALNRWEDTGLTGDDSRTRMRLIDLEELATVTETDPFIELALDRFETWDNVTDEFEAMRDASGRWLYRYARSIRELDLKPRDDSFSSELPMTQVANPLQFILVIEMRADWVQDQERLNHIYLGTAGLLASLLAIAAFWYITTRIVLSPVRVLRETAEKVAEGDLNIRSDINTGDEFEQLALAFNTMLANLKTGRDDLKDVNRQLDDKLNELAQSNLSLFEANRVKGDFLANVSHELRTPLNSIIGFGEVLAENMGKEGADGAKQQRYIENILNSSRSLLQMITELLDLSRIEAGRIDLHIDPTSIAEMCEGLLSVMAPQAAGKRIQLGLDVEEGLPVIVTDAGKMQQILFNFLSNAIKFTPEGGRVQLGAEAFSVTPSGEPTGIRIWVTDTGPGIAVNNHEKIFEKFRQLDSTHTKEHAGSGLGLAISRELAILLGGRIELVSDLGRGATFYLYLPLELGEAKGVISQSIAGG